MENKKIALGKPKKYNMTIQEKANLKNVIKLNYQLFFFLIETQKDLYVSINTKLL